MARKPSKQSTTTTSDADTAPEPTTSEPTSPAVVAEPTSPAVDSDAGTSEPQPEPSDADTAPEPEPQPEPTAGPSALDAFTSRSLTALGLADPATGTIPSGALSDAVSAYGALRVADRADAVGSLAEQVMDRCSLDDSDADALPATAMAAFRRLRTALADAPRTTSKPEPTSAERAAMLGNRAAILLGFGFAIRHAAIALDSNAGRVAIPSDAQTLADAMERGNVKPGLVDALDALTSTTTRRTTTTSGAGTSQRGSGAPLDARVAQAMLALGLDDSDQPRPVLVSAIVKHAGLASSGAVTNRVRGSEPDSKHQPIAGIVSHYADSGARSNVLHALIADVDAVRTLAATAGTSEPSDADTADDSDQ